MTSIPPGGWNPPKPEKPKRKCPKCGSETVAEILWGMPIPDDELNRALEAGEIVLGGCVIEENAKAFHCNACKHKWGKVRTD